MNVGSMLFLAGSIACGMGHPGVSTAPMLDRSCVLVSAVEGAESRHGGRNAPSVAQRMPGASIRAEGIGYPPGNMTGSRAKLMARRAAEVAAVRALHRRLVLPSGARTPPFRWISVEWKADGSVIAIVEAVVR